MRIFPFKALLPDRSIIASPSSFAVDVKRNFRNYIDTGYFNSRKKPECFVYQIKSSTNVYWGLLAALDIEEIGKGNVLPHENTLPHREQISMQLILERESMIKPLFLTYQPDKTIREILIRTVQNKRPLQSFFYSNTKDRHSIWPIKEKKDLDKLLQAFDKKVSRAYIADGHHRSVALDRLYRNKRKSKSKSYDQIMTAFFDFGNLQILDYNRLIKFSDIMSSLELMARISQKANITPIPSPEKPRKKFELTFYMGSNWFRLEWKNKIVKARRDVVVLDAAILNDEILKGVLGFKYIESDQHIKYLQGNLSLQDIEARVDRHAGSVAFCLYPVQISELEEQANNGMTLPPKSTFFEPRLPNGFVTQFLGIN